MGNTRNIAFWAILFLLLIAVFNIFSSNNSSVLSKEVTFSEFMDQVENGRVTSVRLDGEIIDVLLESGEKYRVVRPIGSDVVTPLRDNGVQIQAIKQAQSGLMSTISVWLPFILLIGIWIFLMNRMQGGGRGGGEEENRCEHRKVQEPPCGTVCWTRCSSR